MSKFTDSVAHNLEGLEAFSVGACPGCKECGLAETQACKNCDDGSCILCDDNGEIPYHPSEYERECADESHFSWSDCDSCGSSLGGDRHPAHYWNKTGEGAKGIFHLEVCTNCLFYHANGDEPESWQ